MARRQLTNLSERVRHDVERLTCRFVGVSEHEEKLTVARNIVVAAVEAIQSVAPLEQHSLARTRLACLPLRRSICHPHGKKSSSPVAAHSGSTPPPVEIVRTGLTL
jgi:hypothetical protein